MAKEAKPQAETPEQPETAPTKKKSILPLLIWVVGGVILLAATAVVTVMLIQVSPSPDAEAQATDTTAVASDAPHQKLDSLKEVMKAKEGSEVTSDETTNALTDTTEQAALEESSPDELEKMLAAIESMNEEAQAQAEAQMMQEQAVSVADTAEALSWIDKEKKALEEKSKELGQREQELNAQEERISKAMLKIEQASSDRVTNLAKLYDGMESKSVANLMANLDDETVVAIIPRMKQKNASAVMSLLPPARAAGISRQIINLAEEE